MKKTDAQLIISAVGRAVRKLLDPLRGEVTQLTEKLAKAEATIVEQRQLIDTIQQNHVKFVEWQTEAAATLIAIKSTAPPVVPTLDEIVEKIHIVQPPTLEEITEHVMSAVPTTDQVKQYAADAVAAAMPKAGDIAKLVTVPAVPTAEEIAKLVVVPSAEDVAKLVPVPMIPSAEEIAKHVPVPELPTIELPELPEIPTLDQIVASVKEILPTFIPAPIKGDTGKSVTIDDVRPIIEELIKALPKPQDGKSLTIDDVRPLFAEWIVEFERLAVDRHGKLLAQLPKAKNGVDGLGFDHLRTLKAEQVGDRLIQFFVMRDEERIDLCEIKLSHPLYKDVFSEEKQYERGDQVTRDGCQWIALKDQPQGIPGQSDDWQLAVKKGRDGRDFKPKETTPTRVRVAPRKE
jgi:hypothetical protein